MPGTILVEADDAQFLQLQKNVGEFDRWRLHKQLLAGMDGTVVFHQASNSAESGLLAPENLLSLWPNIKTHHKEARQAITLASLLQDEDNCANWLMVDCLPALPIVQGAGGQLDRFDVIAVRVVFDDEAPDVSVASRSQLDSYLNSCGYRCIAAEPGRHPAVGHALYVRDTQALICRLHQQQVQQRQTCQLEIQELNRANNTAEQLAKELHQEISKLTEAQQAVEKLAAARQQQIDQLEQDNATQARQLRKACEELSNVIDLHVNETDQLGHAKAAAEKLASERLQEVEQLQRANTSQAEQLAQGRAELSKAVEERTAQSRQLAQAREAAAKLAAEHLQQVERLEQATASQAEQLAQSRAELSKAVEEHIAEISQLEQARATADKLATEHQQQIEQIKQANATQAKQFVQIRAELSKLADERAAQINQLEQASEVAHKVATERQQEIEQLKQDGINQTMLFRQKLEELTKIAEERSTRINELANAKDAAEKLADALQKQLAKIQGSEQKVKQAVRIDGEKLQHNGLEEKSGSDKELGFSDQPANQAQKKQIAPKKESGDSSRKFSADANIDELIADISPFFFKKSLTYVDIGAYVGEVFLKLYQSKDIKIREAHLYEPNPESYSQLKNNVDACDISSLHTYNFALSNQSGKKKFSSAKAMTKVTVTPVDEFNSTNTFTAESYGLDQISLAFTDKHIDFLKIDVEGQEMDVLLSATNLLTEQRIDLIYIEVGFNKHGTQQTYFAEIDFMLQSFGYRVFKIYEQKSEWMQDSPLLRRCNFAYMSSRFAGANPYKATLEIQKLKNEIKDFRQRLGNDH